MNRIVPSGCLLYDKSILFIEIQSLHQRQAVSRSCKIERKLLRYKAFRLHKALRERLLLETAQQHIIRQKVSIPPLHNRIYGQRVFPQSILTCTLLHGRNNERVIESYDLRRLGELKILVGIHEGIHAVLARGHPAYGEPSPAVRTSYAVERLCGKGRIGQIGMQANQQPFHRFQVRCIEQRAGNGH